MLRKTHKVISINQPWLSDHSSLKILKVSLKEKKKNNCLQFHYKFPCHVKFENHFNWTRGAPDMTACIHLLLYLLLLFKKCWQIIQNYELKYVRHRDRKRNKTFRESRYWLKSIFKRVILKEFLLHHLNENISARLWKTSRNCRNEST